jgi:DNA-binding ferritin-like protein
VKKLAQSDSIKLMATYVAFLRALYIIHQNGHWKCKGPNFYAHHLMFERIYKSVAADTDLAAEKTIGLFGNDSIDLFAQSKLIQQITERYSSSDNYIENSLKAEKDFIILSKKIYNTLKESGALSLGLDDAIMAICSNRETNVYLLQQSLA